MLSEGRRERLKLALNRSFSEPGDSFSLARSLPVTPQTVLSPFPFSATTSMPNSPCDQSATIQRTIVLKKTKTIEPSELARRLIKNNKKSLLLDVRPFVAFNLKHIKGSINLNCGDRFNRKRLQMKKATVVDLASSPAGREVLKKRSYKEVIVYDDSNSELESLSLQHPLYLIIAALTDDNREPVLLKGGFQNFQQNYPDLCDNTLIRPRETQIQAPSSLQDMNTINNASVTRVLPFLYLGNARDSHDINLLRDEGIKRVLNLTAHTPTTFSDDVLYKTLPVADTGHQNLLQYFDQALQFIDEARITGNKVLVHCQAGISRSPTIVIAYLMKFTNMTMLNAYKLVKSIRGIISPNLNFMGQLVQWESNLQSLKPTESDFSTNEWNSSVYSANSQYECQIHSSRNENEFQWQMHEVQHVANACQV